MKNLWIIYARKKIPSRYLDEVDRTDTLENVLKLIDKYQEKLGSTWEVYYARLEPVLPPNKDSVRTDYGI